ncbi:MAG: diguanylate cyclase [Pseudoxanthomonas sp.]
MPVAGLNHFNLRAPRDLLETLRRFYVEVVGLREGPRPPFRSFGYWLYAGGRDVLHLTETRPDEVRDTGIDTTFDHVAFDCTGPAAAEARLRRHGVDYAVDEAPLASQKQIFLHDPAGNGIELNFDLGAQSPEPHGAPGA